jgi:ABC-type branched-subunit amino acid transport system ATPase component
MSMMSTAADARQATSVQPAPILEAQGLTAGYGSQPVIHELDLVVHPGEVVALLGANGAGKTTTLLALSGELPTMSGEVHIAGAPCRLPLHARAKQGLGFVTEERSVFMQMSTRDNLRVGRCDEETALELFPRLKERLDVRAGLLSGGEQQMLTLGRALTRDLKVLLADELSLGLAPLIVDRLVETVRAQATERGLGVLLVEQHVRKVLKYADRVYVMQRGRVVLEGTAVDIRSRVSEIEKTYMAGGM